MSPITEGIPALPLRRCEIHLPPTGTRPVTAAPSDESVAADSGVFDASQENLKAAQRGDFDEDASETSQIKIGLNYDVDREALVVCIDQAKGLKALGNTTQCKAVLAKAVLLPSAPSESCVLETKPCDYQDSPVFGEQFHIPVPEVRGASNVSLSAYKHYTHANSSYWSRYSRSLGCTLGFCDHSPPVLWSNPLPVKHPSTIQGGGIDNLVYRLLRFKITLTLQASPATLLLY